MENIIEYYSMKEGTIVVRSGVKYKIVNLVREFTINGEASYARGCRTHDTIKCYEYSIRALTSSEVKAEVQKELDYANSLIEHKNAHIERCKQKRAAISARCLREIAAKPSILETLFDTLKSDEEYETENGEWALFEFSSLDECRELLIALYIKRECAEQDC